MKNLLIYITPEKKFTSEVYDDEISVLPKLQIDNSLELGWKKEDILLVTNFPWEYRGVKSHVLRDNNFNVHKKTATKINAILTLMKHGVIDDEIHWFHDFDAFQMEEITEQEAEELLFGYHLAMTDYGKTTINQWLDRRWSTGSMFFNRESQYLFEIWKDECYRYQANEEVVMLEILKKHRHQHIRELINKINITYNFATRRRSIKGTYEICDKPIKVIHFHPNDDRPVDKGYANMDVCVYGKNSVGKPLVTERLKKLLERYGFK